MNKATIPFLISQLPRCAASLLLLLSLITSAASQSPATPSAAGQLIKVEYDSSKDLTQITMNPIVLASRRLEELRVGAIARYPGQKKTRPSEVLLIFFSLSHTDENRYEAARKLMLVADGKRLDLGETQRSKQSQSGVFIETMVARVPIDDFLLVSKSKQVKLKLGLTEIELSPAQINVLKLTASYLIE
jgi:hypothetical protein